MAPKGAGKAPGPAPGRRREISVSQGCVTPRDAGKGEDGPRIKAAQWIGLVTEVKAQTIFADLADLTAPAPIDTVRLEKAFVQADRRGSACRSSSATPRLAPGAEELRSRVRGAFGEKTLRLLALSSHKLPKPGEFAARIDAAKDFPDGLHPEAISKLHAEASDPDKDKAMEMLRQLKSEVDVAQLDVPFQYLWLLVAVPERVQKLACAKFILGPASDLKDLPLACENVTSCCKCLRRSELIKKCISTSLELLNFICKANSKQAIGAFVLPDSLLKFEETKAIEYLEADGQRLSLLDLLAQALVDEAGARPTKELCEEADYLLAKARSAQTAHLNEAQKSCQAISKEASESQQGIKRLQRTANVNCIEEKLRDIHKEAGDAAKLVGDAMEVADKVQQWFSPRKDVTREDWFKGWASFLELLVKALRRTRAPRPLAHQVSLTLEVPAQPPLRKLSAVQHPPTFPASLGVKNFDSGSLDDAGQQTSTVLAPEAKSFGLYTGQEARCWHGSIDEPASGHTPDAKWHDFGTEGLRLGSREPAAAPGPYEERLGYSLSSGSAPDKKSLDSMALERSDLNLGLTETKKHESRKPDVLVVPGCTTPARSSTMPVCTAIGGSSASVAAAQHGRTTPKLLSCPPPSRPPGKKPCSKQVVEARPCPDQSMTVPLSRPGPNVPPRVSGSCPVGPPPRRPVTRTNSRARAQERRSRE